MSASSSHIVVTGAAGFIGAALTAALRRSAGAADLTLTDREVVCATSPQSTFVAGDITESRLQERLFERPVTQLFHLAGVVSGAAQADFDLGRRVNLAATQALLERCRQQAQSGGPVVRLIYASSIAVFGAPLPARIDDATPPAPVLSYGVHKRVIELLIDDYTRRGFIDGRALRLPGVVVRPPLGNGALSGFNSDLIREPLAGRSYRCPLGPDATIWLCSLPRVIDNLQRMAVLPGEAIGPLRTLNAPALAVSVAQVVAALARFDPQALARVSFEPDPPPDLRAQFGNWPLDCAFERAASLGLRADDDLDALIAAGTAPLA